MRWVMPALALLASAFLCLSGSGCRRIALEPAELCMKFDRFGWPVFQGKGLPRGETSQWTSTRREDGSRVGGVEFGYTISPREPGAEALAFTGTVKQLTGTRAEIDGELVVTDHVCFRLESVRDARLTVGGHPHALPAYLPAGRHRIVVQCDIGCLIAETRSAVEAVTR
ncbi:hypothetical protein [Frigoriglobus tundricola]|uniref:Uncharacterized protein n=1 Tax=Frigoriglobus tundricola TaxID=2774151 RepID=A0A6M5Z2W1_9BACT|nr:hypothetical protein [Frigoriglobus tundricola]QJX00067.1 hypothetical protein FTUN_7691 [Frigoriglobus tundricola]